MEGTEEFSMDCWILAGSECRPGAREGGDHQVAGDHLPQGDVRAEYGERPAHLREDRRESHRGIRLGEFGVLPVLHEDGAAPAGASAALLLREPLDPQRSGLSLEKRRLELGGRTGLP